MRYTTNCLNIICLLLLSGCSKNLTAIPDKSTEEITATYQLTKDVSYGSDAEQKMDIYLSKEAASYGNHNYTIVFIHGGGYYLSDKSEEEKYIAPYLKKGLHVINMNYRLKKGIPIAITDLTNALHFLKANNSVYNLNLDNIIVTGFSAGAHIATYVGVSQNNPEYTNKLKEGITISGIVNFSGPVGRLDVVEKIFMDNENEFFSEIGKAFFPENDGYELKEKLALYEPITYLDKNDAPIFLWYGGNDNQVPPITFEKFIPLLHKNKDVVLYKPEGGHSPNEEELKNAYIEIFGFLDKQH